MGANYSIPKTKRVAQNECGDLTEELVSLNRVSKVVKGGRRFGFSALVVVGNGDGIVGYGLGKANEVQSAMRKASEAAKRNLFKVDLVGGTLPHEVLAKYGSAIVLMKPASPGTGVIAGGPARAVLRQLGVKDILTKSLGTQNPHNVLRAVVTGLCEVESPEDVAKRRGLPLDELGYQVFA